MKARRLSALLIVFVCLIGGAFVVVHGTHKLAMAASTSLTSPSDDPHMNGGMDGMYRYHGMPASAEETRAATRCIVGQLTCFKHGDFTKACQYGSYPFRRRQTPATFEKMVQNGYPIMMHWKSVAFGPVFVGEDGDAAFTQCRLTSSTGEQVTYSYGLIKENGDYHVQGVMNQIPRH